MFNNLTKKALRDEYFWKLFDQVEKNNVLVFFEQPKEKLKRKEYLDLLRFADIFSNSDNDRAKNLAYKIISLLYQERKDDEIFKTFAVAVLAKLGNFPALFFLKEYFSEGNTLPLERNLEKTIKEHVQKTVDGDKIFTDSQYEIFEKLKKSYNFSFSGPTSLGKSFIIDEYLKYLIGEKNDSINICVIVPTKALINQVSQELKQKLSKFKKYKIVTHPVVSEFFKKESDRYIFVFTPERLISFFSREKKIKIDYLFIDEAQKIVAEKDTRNPLYYHAISQAERMQIKLFFASPNIPNPEIFPEIFGIDKSSLQIKESPVSQNKYFLNLKEKESFYFKESGKIKNISIENLNKDFFYWLDFLGRGEQNIIYTNSISDTIQFAQNYSSKKDINNNKDLTVEENNKLNKLIELVKNKLHKDYFLIECLKKRVAFHFGKLPQIIREDIEILFKERIVTDIFCTSTLLEGINLPAKNIFILSNVIGISKFTDIDFWNLAGRAGRLTKDMSGNIICMRIPNKGSSWNSFSQNVKKPVKDCYSDIRMIEKKDISNVRDPLSVSKSRIFDGIGLSLKEKDLNNKKPTMAEREIWHHYANIAILQEKQSHETNFKSNLIKKIKGGSESLAKISKNITVPDNIIFAHSSISLRYQNDVYNLDNLKSFPTEVTYENSIFFLKLFYEKYGWKIEEASGKDGKLINTNRDIEKVFKYYAFLMSSWMNSESLAKIIPSTIVYYKNNNRKILDYDRNLLDFDKNNKEHVNLLINKLLGDIDYILKFTLKKYFDNYYALLESKVGGENAGPNWAEYLEYGTTDFRLIELQNIGCSRDLAKYLLDNHFTLLDFNEQGLININEGKLEVEFDKKSEEYNEYTKLFVKC